MGLMKAVGAAPAPAARTRGQAARRPDQCLRRHQAVHGSNTGHTDEFCRRGRSTRTCTIEPRPEATLTDPVHPTRTVPTITPVLVADLLAEDDRMPVYVHVIDHPDARVLV